MNRFQNLQRLVTTAAIDERFCARLLNGDRPRVIADFALTQDEKKAVMAVKASNLQQLAQGLEVWMSSC